MSIWSEQVTVRGPQDLEDVATAGWLSGALFAALDLDLFESIGLADVSLDMVAERTGADPDALRRLVETLAALGLLSLHEGSGGLQHGGAATPARAERGGYLGHSLRYRQRLAAHWPRLAEAVRLGGSPLAAADALARRRDRSDSRSARRRRAEAAATPTTIGRGCGTTSWPWTTWPGTRPASSPTGCDWIDCRIPVRVGSASCSTWPAGPAPWPRSSCGDIPDCECAGGRHAGSGGGGAAGVGRARRRPFGRGTSSLDLRGPGPA